MNSEVQPLPTDNTRVEDKTTENLGDERTRSAPFSDYINNRSMSGGDQEAVFPNGSTSIKEEVATWLENTQSPLKVETSLSVEPQQETSAFEGVGEDAQLEQVCHPRHFMWWCVRLGTGR